MSGWFRRFAQSHRVFLWENEMLIVGAQHSPYCLQAINTRDQGFWFRQVPNGPSVLSRADTAEALIADGWQPLPQIPDSTAS